MANDFNAVGRRKSAVARVRLVPGEGKILVNKRDINDYFGLETLKMTIRQPMNLVKVGENFDVLVCPWLNVAGTKSLGKLAAGEKLFGMLATTWHISHNRHLSATVAVPAATAWNPDAGTSFLAPLARQMRLIARDMGTTSYDRSGFCTRQVDPGTHPHELK